MISSEWSFVSYDTPIVPKYIVLCLSFDKIKDLIICNELFWIALIYFTQILDAFRVLVDLIHMFIHHADDLNTVTLPVILIL